MRALSTDIQKYADAAMYRAEEVDADKGPQVFLVNMTSDPLGSVAAFSAMYEGKVKRSASDVSDAERSYYLEQMLKTKLKAPLEAIHFHFLIEGVTRAFTHQMVRQRTAVYAQESMRFAVKETMPTALPPSLAGTLSRKEWFLQTGEAFPGLDEDGLMKLMDRESDKQRMRFIWDGCVNHIEGSYTQLINMGMPAEDARGLAPTNVLTRLNYDTNLRNLLDHAGNRLCTQAQFEWRLVFTQIAKAIQTQGPRLDRRWVDSGFDEEVDRKIQREYDAIASLFRPVCYMTGKCEFGAEFDRKCTIRSRVEANHSIGRPSSEWHKEFEEEDADLVVAGFHPQHTKVVEGTHGRPVFIGPIHPAEWLLNPAAAR